MTQQPLGRYIGSFYCEPMYGKWLGSDCASIAPRFVDNNHRKHLKSRIVLIWGFLEKSLEHRMPPILPLEAPVASQTKLKNTYQLLNLKIKPWKTRNSQRRARKTHRNWSGWNPLNSNGVSFGDENDSLISMDIHELSMDIHGYMADPLMILGYPWMSMVIHG